MSHVRLLTNEHKLYILRHLKKEKKRNMFTSKLNVYEKNILSPE